jgi:D-galactarolactone cycloisomerase
LQRLLLEGCYDILQPDVTLSEGVLRTRALAKMAQAASVQVVPHTWADPLGMIANLHLAASIPNTSYFEFPHDPPAFPAEVYQKTLKQPLKVDKGMIQLPQEPGLGVDLEDWIFD